MKLSGNEKAFLGGFVAFLAASVVQVAQSGKVTWKEFGYSLVVWVFTHATVYLTTNTTPSATPAAPASPSAPAAPADSSAAQPGSTVSPSAPAAPADGGGSGISSPTV